MNRFEAIGVVLGILLAGSCQGTTRHVKTVPTAQIQASVDECVKTSGDKGCRKVCQEVFAHSVDKCTVETKGETSDVWYESPTVDEPEPEPGCAPGRRPAGLACARAPRMVVDYLAWGAQMEAASVTAFTRVHRTLVALGANEALTARVRSAIADEIAHAHAMVALARRYGAEPTAPVIADIEPRPLVDHAIENAVEGCVGETVSAIHAALIATHAADPVVRDVFAQIALDESEHALLSYDLAAEYARHLDETERARVTAAYRTAVAAPAYRRVTAPLAALHVPDDGSLGAAVDRTLAALAARMA